MRVAILGFGKEGMSLKKFLRRDPRYKRAVIEVRDLKQGKQYLKGLNSFDIVFRSPGIPYLTPEIQNVKKKGVIISSATKLFFEEISLLPKSKQPKLIGITGSKGKGTTATLLYEILKNAGKKVVLAGNIGTPMLDVLKKTKSAEYVILELSSFQLQDLTTSPQIAVVVEMFPEHLDHHKNTNEYLHAKSSITRFQKPGDAVFYFGDNPLSKKVIAGGKGKKIPIYPTQKSVKKNFEMARAIALYLKIPISVIDAATAEFKGLEHRLEFVRKIPITPAYHAHPSAIYFYNYSAATNPEAAALAIRSFHAPLILLAGGKDKGLDYTILGKEIYHTRNVQMIVLFGENKEKIRAGIMHEFRNSKKTIAAPHLLLTKNLPEALKTAFAFAKSATTNGYWLNAVVLFSPASASFDQFKNYAERGKTFKRLVQRLK